MRRYQVSHTTTYRYENTVSHSRNEAHLIPRASAYQRCVAHVLNIQPQPTSSHEYIDVFGNRVTLFTLRTPHAELVVSAQSEIERDQFVPPDFKSSLPWNSVQQRLEDDETDEVRDAYLFTLNSPHVQVSPALQQYAATSFVSGQPILAVVWDLIQRIYHDFSYDPHATEVTTPLGDVLLQRRGVCQDFSHVAIGCLRAYGLAARYVSGYIETQSPSEQPRLIGADASHAWVSVYSPGHGWVDFDPTNNLIPSDRHITLAWGRDYSDVAPLKGTFVGEGGQMLQVAVNVRCVGGD